MPRRKSGSQDPRDWMTRVKDQLTQAEAMPPGPARDEIVKKAEQLRTAAEMMGFLRVQDPRTST